MYKRKKDDTISNIDARNTIIMEEIKKREQEILEKHEYSVWFGKDEYWHTYVYDLKKKAQRKPLKRKEHLDLLLEIDKAQKSIRKETERMNRYLDCHSDEKEISKSKRLTLENLYNEWIQYKFIISNASSYVYRISVDWNRFYNGSKFIKVPLKELDSITISVFLHSLIKAERLTRKQFYNMAIILKQGLEYALQKGYIASNPYDAVSVDSKLFTKVKKKADETQVFLVDEEQQLIDAVMADYKMGQVDSVALAVVVAFKTGLRLGELVALRFSDIQHINLNIQRMEINEFEMHSDGTIYFKGVTVVEHTKTDNSIRTVYLTEFVRELLEKIKKCNEEDNNQDEDYIFCRKGKRVRSLTVEKMIYLYCQKIGISRKSMHKIRKTYISTLIDGNININKIRQLVGHADERTTYNSYCFNRYSESQTNGMLEDILA